jgi:hypothetical protein
MDLGTISHLVGVTGASFMSSNALFSLFNWKMRNIRDNARKDHAKASVEERQRKGELGKAATAGLVVLREDKNTAAFWYCVWLGANILPVAISFLLAFVLSAPVVVSGIQDCAEEWIVGLLKCGVWGLVLSLAGQALAIFKMFRLRRRIDKRMSASPNELFQK